MLEGLLLLIPIGLIALFSEYLWRKKILRGESSRKLVHIIAGIWISFWPFWVDYHVIQILGLVLFTGLAVSKHFKLFHAVHDVNRKTWGELFYPLTVFLAASMAPPEWIFTLAILYMALSDGLAAIMGTHYRKQTHVYKVFGQKKSVLGTLVYLLSAVICSLLIFQLLAVDNSFSFNDYVPLLIMTSIVATALENFLPYGIDNLVIPVFVVFVLS